MGTPNDGILNGHKLVARQQAAESGTSRQPISPYADACWSGAISTIRNSGNPRSRLHLLHVVSVFGSTRNLYNQPKLRWSVIGQTSETEHEWKKDKFDKPITPEPSLANFPVRMREYFVSVYGDRRRKVMQTIDKIEAACGSPIQHKRYSGTTKKVNVPRSRISRSRRSGWGMRSMTLSITSVRDVRERLKPAYMYRGERS